MSAFFVEHKTIDHILFGMGDIARTDETLHDNFSKRLYEFGVDMSKSDWKDTLGKDMLCLNAHALQQRYHDPDIDGILMLANEYTYRLQPTTPVQSIKSLQCWLYQCSEGNVPDTHLFKFFDESVLLVMLKEFVRCLPAYDTAEWR